jgi:hypothetical protein
MASKETRAVRAWRGGSADVAPNVGPAGQHITSSRARPARAIAGGRSWRAGRKPDLGVGGMKRPGVLSRLGERVRPKG